MHIEDIRSPSFYQKKKNIHLYKGFLSDKPILLKCALSPDPPARQAFMDEYHVMSRLSHPEIPSYYGIIEEKSVLALCMEDCSGPDRVSFSSLSLPEILDVLSRVCSLLSWLLEQGVLYTDLNPANLILTRRNGNLSLSLVDYTCCYFFLKNPHPDYSLRFSYNLSPDLKGQQLLIQELSFFLEDLLSDRDDLVIPSDIYRLIETGREPSDRLSLSDFYEMIQELALFHGSSI